MTPSLVSNTALIHPSLQVILGDESKVRSHASLSSVRPDHGDTGSDDSPPLSQAAEDVSMSIDPDYPVVATVSGLEQYQLIKRMGEGAFSKVYHAIHLASREHIAIKIIEKVQLNPIQRASVQKEASVHARLHHPNIVTLRQHFETDLHYVFILELAPGGELFHRIVEITYFSEELARHVIVQVAQGIHYLHHQVGVVHRDIKPENLLFTPIPFPTANEMVPTGRTPGEEKVDEGPFRPGIGGGGIGVVKIADFGLSKIVWTDGTKTPCGTIGYTAPEIVTSQSYTASVDLWALGCVLYTMLCGFPPFHDEDQIALTQKVIRGEWTFLQPWWNNVSSSAKHLVSRLLEVRPERRYTIDQFFAHPWVKAIGTTTKPLEERTHAVNRPLNIPSVIIEDLDDDDEKQSNSSLIYDSPEDPLMNGTLTSGGAGAFDWSTFHLPNLVTPAKEHPMAMGGLFGLPTHKPPTEPTSGTTHMLGGPSNPWNMILQMQPAAKTPSQRNFKQYFAASYRAANDLVDTTAGISPGSTGLPEQMTTSGNEAGTNTMGNWSGWGLGVLPRFMAPLSSGRMRSIGGWRNKSNRKPGPTKFCPHGQGSICIDQQGPDYAGALARVATQTEESTRCNGSEGPDMGGFSLDLRDSSILSRRRNGGK